jgi:hypothetical protein
LRIGERELVIRTASAKGSDSIRTATPVYGLFHPATMNSSASGTLISSPNSDAVPTARWTRWP